MSPSWHWQHQQAYSLNEPILTLSNTHTCTATYSCTYWLPPAPNIHIHALVLYIHRWPSCSDLLLHSPLSRRRSHIETHMLIILATPAGVQVPALPPSLPLLKSLIKTLLWIRGVKPFLMLPSSPFSPPSLSPFCLIENVYSRKGPGEGETCQRREGGARTTN